MKSPTDKQRVIEQYRRVIEPSQDQLAQVRARLEARRQPAPRRASWVVGLVCAAAAAVLLAWWGADAEIVAPQSRPPSVQAQRETADVPGDEARLQAPPRSPAPSRATPAPAAPPPRPAPQRAARTVAPSVPSPAPAALRLAAEAKLIQEAEAQLREHSFTEALQTLETHAQSFPAGTLSIERRALRSIALCRSGNLAQGRGEGAALRRDPASAPYRGRIDQACKS